MNIPDNLKYTREHEWVRIEGDAAVVGITDYAQGELGDVIYVDITESLGMEVEQGAPLGSIEAVKTVSEIYSPLTGNIQDINMDIQEKASLLNTDPYGDGWIIKIKFDDASQLDSLLDAAAYKELIGE
jgi:glycine cleavage system H protein